MAEPLQNGTVASPLLETKLFAPKRRHGVVPRSRLTEQLDRAAKAKLTLISAPAGFGKTTLLADWLATAPADQRGAAWLSLDAGDQHPATFWAYVMGALRTAAPGLGEDARRLLDAPQTSIEMVLTALLNELSAIQGDVVLVLDDYHLVDGPDIGDGMAFLLERMPPQMHVVITTRADPALPLARLRSRGDLVEIRAADLRFTPDEATAYLNGTMGLALTSHDVEVLEGRTEGWIAALQLAALSIKGRSDVGTFIDSFAGDDRYIVDYLVEEVLQRQPGHVRRFLLETSILVRLTGPLCDAVTGQRGGKAMLEALDRGNLFLVPLDDRRRWYRFHHLFADVLRARLLDEQPDTVPELHRRASAWYEQHGERADAISHALAADDFDRATDLIELEAGAMQRRRQESTLRHWLDRLPERVFESRPVLAMAHVGARMSSGDLRGVDARLADAERWVRAAHDQDAHAAAVAAGMIVHDTAALARLPGAISLHRAGLALMRGDLAGTITDAQTALELSREDQPLERGGAAGLMGLAYWTRGDLEPALEAWSHALTNLERAGHLSDVLGGSIATADIQIARGNLRDARRTYERGLHLAMASGQPPLRGAADMHVGISDLYREWNDIVAAEGHLEASKELGEAVGLPQNAYRWRVAMARVRETKGDLDGALELLDEAQRCYVSDFFPEVRPIAVMRARVWVAQGRWADALTFAEERGLASEDELSYLHEFEHITLARALLAQSRLSPVADAMGEVMELLERLLHAAETGGRTRSVIEILVLRALGLDSGGDRAAALASLERALALAEPEGYVRIFADEGRAMTSLLDALARRRIFPEYVRALLAALGSAEPPRPAGQRLVEPLSERELDVLRLLAGDLDGPDIARELVVSLNTMRSHTKSIYAKLGVNDRRSAVRRAAEIGLLSRTRAD